MSDGRAKRHNGVPGSNKRDKTYGNDEQRRYSSAGAEADAKLQELMFRHHRDRYTTTTRPGTESPRFVSARPLSFSRNGSPAALCAAAGESEGTLTEFR